jgi:hypothetical protein
MARALLTISTVALLLATTIAIPPSSAQGDELEVITWTKDDSPIVLNETVEIPKDTALDIEPGVEVRLGVNVSIVIRGELRALGTQEQPIRFGPKATGVLVPRMWGNVSLHTLPQGREHVVKWTEFSGADAGLLLSSANVSVDDCIFYACRNGILAMAQSNVEVYRSNFNGSSAAGIEWNNGAGGLASDCTFENNNVGVYCFDGGVPLLTDCTFTVNNHHLSFALGSNATVVGCSLADSNAEVIECYWSSAPVLEDVTITGVDGPRIFLFDSCRPRFLRGINITAITVSASDAASYATKLMEITILVRNDAGKVLRGANITVLGASGDVLFEGATKEDGRVRQAVMANFTYSSSGGLDRENPQNVTVEWGGYTQTFFVDPRDLTDNNVLVLELAISKTEPEGSGIWLWILLLIVVLVSAGLAMATRRR